MVQPYLMLFFSVQTLSSVSPTLINTGTEQHVKLPNVADLSNNNSGKGGMDNNRADYESR